MQGHGKEAPDGVGATCKRTADKFITQKVETNLDVFADTLRENCLKIEISVIADAEIKNVNNFIKKNIKVTENVLKEHSRCIK